MDEIKPVAWRYQDEELFGDGQCRYLDLPPIRQYKRVEALYSQSAIDAVRADADMLRKLVQRVVAEADWRTSSNDLWAELVAAAKEAR